VVGLIHVQVNLCIIDLCVYKLSTMLPLSSLKDLKHEFFSTMCPSYSYTLC
jgi:hypothetical protein